jgi:uncharacterized protein YkwD
MKEYLVKWSLVFLMVFCVCSVAEARGRRVFARPVNSGSNSGSQNAVVDKAPVYQVEVQLLQAVNAERRRFGLVALVLDPVLHLRTRRHCGWMANSGAMVHSADPSPENIAMGQQSVQDVINAWMNSPGHRANILNSGITKIGLAGYMSPDGVPFWCQQFE